MGDFPIHGENLGQEIALLGKFWVFTGKEGLLSFHIPILGICCECLPKLFPMLGTIWEYFPSYSQYGELWGTFPQVIPRVVKNMDTLPQVIPKIVNDIETFTQGIPRIVINMGTFTEGIPRIVINIWEHLPKVFPF